MIDLNLAVNLFSSELHKNEQNPVDPDYSFGFGFEVNGCYYEIEKKLGATDIILCFKESFLATERIEIAKFKSWEKDMKEKMINSIDDFQFKKFTN